MILLGIEFSAYYIYFKNCNCGSCIFWKKIFPYENFFEIHFPYFRLISDTSNSAVETLKTPDLLDVIFCGDIDILISQGDFFVNFFIFLFIYILYLTVTTFNTQIQDIYNLLMWLLDNLKDTWDGSKVFAEYLANFLNRNLSKFFDITYLNVFSQDTIIICMCIIIFLFIHYLSKCSWDAIFLTCAIIMLVLVLFLDYTDPCLEKYFYDYFWNSHKRK